MGADIADRTAVHDQNPIRILYGGNSLCDDDLGRFRNVLTQRLADLCVRLGIHRTGRIVENPALRLL